MSDCLMIKLEGDSIKDFNPDASIQFWFNVIARRLGGSQRMENIKYAKEAAVGVSRGYTDYHQGRAIGMADSRID